MVSPVRHYLLLAGNPQCLLHEANLSCYFVDLCVCMYVYIYIYVSILLELTRQGSEDCPCISQKCRCK